jgi:hypothetical protein
MLVLKKIDARSWCENFCSSNVCETVAARIVKYIAIRVQAIPAVHTSHKARTTPTNVESQFAAKLAGKKIPDPAPS